MNATATSIPGSGMTYVGINPGSLKIASVVGLSAHIEVELDELGRVIGLEIDSVRLAMMIENGVKKVALVEKANREEAL